MLSVNTRSHPSATLRPRYKFSKRTDKTTRDLEANGPERSSAVLLKRDFDWFEFKLNTPTASHAGGVWERMIRTVRSVLDGLLEQHGTQLDEESLRTLLCEVECIVNSRPIAGTNTPEEEPLTPNHLLTMKTRVLMPSPGTFKGTTSTL